MLLQCTHKTLKNNADKVICCFLRALKFYQFFNALPNGYNQLFKDFLSEKGYLTDFHNLNVFLL